MQNAFPLNWIQVTILCQQIPQCFFPNFLHLDRKILEWNMYMYVLTWEGQTTIPLKSCPDSDLKASHLIPCQGNVQLHCAYT